MNERDQKQREAIRTLAKLSATRDLGRSPPRVDPRMESKERDRISRLVNPNHVETGPGPESKTSRVTELVVMLMVLGILLPIIGYGLYGIIKAIMSA